MVNIRRALHQYYRKQFEKSDVKSAEEEILRYDRLDASAQAEARTEKLMRLLKRAGMEVTYYRNVFDQHGFEFTDVQSLKKFREMPLLSKEIIRENFDSIKNIHIDQMRWFINKTSGSTGKPLTFIIDRDFNAQKLGLKNFQMQVNGKREEDTLVKLWGFFGYDFQPAARIKHLLGNLLTNQMDLVANYLNEDLMRDYCRRMQKKKSVFIEAYAQSAYELAKYINRNQIDMKNVRGVVTSVSTLFDFMRAEIEKAFNCPVFNRYGTRETSVLAFERAGHESLCAASSQYIIEILDENGRHCQEGEEGEVVVTNFSNFAFPFIRYQIGDRAVAGRITEAPVRSCLSLKHITGRVADKILREDGSYVDSSYFSTLIGHALHTDWIDQMQVIQRGYHDIQVNIVRTARENADEAEMLERIRKGIKKMMGEKCQVEFNFISEIESTGSGKFQYIQSLIDKA